MTKNNDTNIGFKEKSMIEIYFDEAGNTGHDLLNTSQPFYVLSSTTIKPEKAESLLKEYFSNIDQLHFKKKRKSIKGRKEILNFWNNNFEFLKNNFKSIIIEKKFMIVCQMLNYLVEPQLYKYGIDYYDEGMNISHANMMYMCIPVFCGVGLANRLYNAFIEMFKIKNSKSIKSFYKILSLLEQNSKSEDFKEEIFILQKSIEKINETISYVNKDILDPAMHSLISLISAWNNELKAEFNVFHDRSNTINNQKAVLDFLNSIDGPDISIGYGAFKAIYPLKMNDFQFISNDNYSIKVCDIVSSSILYASVNDDDFAVELKKILNNWTYTNNIMPSNYVGKITGRKKNEGDIDSIDFFAEKMMNKGY